MHLGKQQQRALILLARGYTQKQIARELDLSPETVKNMVHAINIKIGAENTAHAVALALIRKQVDPSEVEAGFVPPCCRACGRGLP